jgi:hypothetical protein
MIEKCRADVSCISELPYVVVEYEIQVSIAKVIAKTLSVMPQQRDITQKRKFVPQLCSVLLINTVLNALADRVFLLTDVFYLR